MAIKKIKVGVIGYGWAAGAHIEAINKGTWAEVSAIYSSRPLDAGEVSRKHGGSISVYTDLKKFLASDGMEVVTVTSYPWQHARQIVAAAKAGKHIIAEKPLVLSLRDLRVVEKAVKEAGVHFAICFECRFSSQFRATRAMIEKGMLGKIHYGEVDYYHGIGPWYGQFRWNVTKKGGGSSLLTAGCHALDALLLCLGDDVTEVFSYDTGSASAVFKKYEYPTTSVTLLKFKNGSVGKCAAVVDCFQPYYFHTHLVGSEGSLLDNKFHSNALPGLNKNKWSEVSMSMLDSGDVADHPYQTEFEAFFESLSRGARMPLAGLEEAIRTHEIIFAADRSAREGRPVKVKEIQRGR